MLRTKMVANVFGDRVDQLSIDTLLKLPVETSSDLNSPDDNHIGLKSGRRRISAMTCPISSSSIADDACSPTQAVNISLAFGSHPSCLETRSRNVPTSANLTFVSGR